MRVDADTLLQQWGLWQRSGSVPMGYTSPAFAMMRDNTQTACQPMAWMDEEDTERCDRVVTRLGSTNRICADVLITYYCTNRTQHGVGKVLGISRRKVGELLDMGRMYVQSEIDARTASKRACA